MSQSERETVAVNRLSNYNKLENVSQSEQGLRGQWLDCNYNKLENVSQSEPIITLDEICMYYNKLENVSQSELKVRFLSRCY